MTVVKCGACQGTHTKEIVKGVVKRRNLLVRYRVKDSSGWGVVFSYVRCWRDPQFSLRAVLKVSFLLFEVFGQEVREF